MTGMMAHKHTTTTLASQKLQRDAYRSPQALGPRGHFSLWSVCCPGVPPDISTRVEWPWPSTTHLQVFRWESSRYDISTVLGLFFHFPLELGEVHLPRVLFWSMILWVTLWPHRARSSPTLQYCERGPTWKQVLCRNDQVKMTSYSLRPTLIQIHCDSWPEKKGGKTQRHTGKYHETMGTDWRGACTTQSMPAALKLRKGITGPLPAGFRENMALLMPLQPPALEDKTFLLFPATQFEAPS